MPIINKLICFIIIAVIMSCNESREPLPGEGFIHVKGGKVWYRIEGSGNNIPLVLLHGGPGVPSYYLKPLAALSKDRPVIFFDQLGCGRSERITDTSLMTTDVYVEQLHDLLKQLGINEFYLYGHSWGTMLGMDYWLKHPEGVRAIIFASPALSIPLWVKDADTLIATLPDSVQQAIRMNEQRKTYHDEGYQKAMTVYYNQFLCRKQPWPADVDSAFSLMGTNVYEYMEGPSEFTLSGELKNYDRTKELSQINIPVLFVAGEYDEARPATVKYYQSLVKNAEYAQIPGAGHLTMQDNPEANNNALRKFLAETDHK